MEPLGSIPSGAIHTEGVMEMDLWIKAAQGVAYLLMVLVQALNLTLTVRRWRREKVNYAQRCD